MSLRGMTAMEARLLISRSCCDVVFNIISLDPLPELREIVDSLA